MQWPGCTVQKEAARTDGAQGAHTEKDKWQQDAHEYQTDGWVFSVGRAIA